MYRRCPHFTHFCNRSVYMYIFANKTLAYASVHPTTTVTKISAKQQHIQHFYLYFFVVKEHYLRYVACITSIFASTNAVICGHILRREYDIDNDYGMYRGPGRGITTRKTEQRSLGARKPE